MERLTLDDTIKALRSVAVKIQEVVAMQTTKTSYIWMMSINALSVELARI